MHSMGTWKRIENISRFEFELIPQKITNSDLIHLRTSSSTAIVDSMTATSASMVLGEYLGHISFIKDKLPIDIREEARIGADVIAASSQYSIVAAESLSIEDTPSAPLPVFALVRSAIYGLIYLDNVDLVRRKEKLPSPGKFIQKTMEGWPKGNTFGLGVFDHTRNYHDLVE